MNLQDALNSNSMNMPEKRSSEGSSNNSNSHPLAKKKISIDPKQLGRSKFSFQNLS